MVAEKNKRIKDKAREKGKTNAEEEEEEEEEEYAGGGGEGFFDKCPCWAVSMAVHTVMLVIMAIIQMEIYQPQAPPEIIAEAPDEPVIEEEVEDDDFDVEVEDVNVSDVEVSEVTEVQATEVMVETDDEPMPAQVEISPNGIFAATQNTPNALLSGGGGNGTGLRKNADATALRSGGSRGSQKAVALGLKWISRHQFSNGGWNFNHTVAPQCKGKCANPGTSVKAVNAATALGILPFLGCGQTHKEGKYKEVVYRGLNFLCGNMKPNPNVGGGSLHEADGSMYSHGLSAICLTEAYGMTKDKALAKPAQFAVDFIQGAQDPAGGGWRYQPKQAGDTSVVGWQMMALKSGFMAYLKIDPKTAQNAMRFLDSVQAEYGATYGYQTPGAGQATTAIGLLCRMYYGWKHDNPALSNGVGKISAWGPSKGNMYYNYYATQVMRHFGGDQWKKWNSIMRDQLVNKQVRDEKSHQLGSWTPSGEAFSNNGGRLYETAMSIMTLEVYYRYSPIYQTQSTEALPLE